MRNNAKETSIRTKYTTLLFDADETLLDFQAAQYNALTNLFQNHSYEITNSIREQYNELNISLWKAYERGEISRDEVLNTRFERLFHMLGYSVDGIAMELEYHQELNNGHDLIPGAHTLLESLTPYYNLYIVTNGVADTQFKRLTDSGLINYFKTIFVSETVGFQKPRNEFFQYVFQQIPDFDLSKTLIIGDSLSSDIKGGINAGIDTCWFNPGHLENKTNIIPNYEIYSLKELCEMLT